MRINGKMVRNREKSLKNTKMVDVGKGKKIKKIWILC